MSDNPLKYSDLFDFSDNGGIKAAIRDIKKLKDVYKEFTDQVTAGQFQALSDQQKALAETVRQLADASRELNITQKASQKQLLENAATMAKLDAQAKILNETQKASKKTNEAVKGSVDQLTLQLKEQLKQYNALGQSKQRDIEKAKSLANSINATRAQISQLNSAVRVNITAFTAASGSYNQLDAQTKKLILDLKNLPDAFGRNAAAARQMQTQINSNIAKLKEFDKQMNITTRNVGNYSSAFDQIGSSIATMVGPLAIFTAALAGLRRIVQTNIEISDSLSDVRRTAQLTEKDANILLDTFKKFDTRTSLKGLLDIAVIAGQLGIANDDIAGFVKSIDGLAIVLSGEIPGGAEEVATALGKINEVFQTQIKEGTDIEEAYNRTGSAILGLGQAGLATGAFLQDFTQRVGGVAVAANISLPTILAYGSVLEEAGSSAEVAGTSLNRLIGSLSSKRDKFFAIAKLADANLTLKEFTHIINTDANEALQLFFKGLASGNPALTTFNDRLDTIGIKAGPSKNAIIALAREQEKLSEKIQQSNKDYLDAGKVADQLEVKNNNLAASFDKLTNKVTNITTDPDSGIGKLFKYIVDAAGDAVDEINVVIERFALLGALLKTYKVDGTPISGTKALKIGMQKQEEENQQKASAQTNAARLVNASTSDVDLLKKIANEEYKLNQIRNKIGDQNKELERRKDVVVALGEKEKYYSSEADAARNLADKNAAQARENLKKTSKELIGQRFLVEELKKAQAKLYPVAKKAKDEGGFISDEDAAKAAAKAKALKERLAREAEQQRDAQNALLQEAAKYQVAVLELEYAQGEQSYDAEIQLEAKKLIVLEESFKARLALYKEDSIDYKKIQTEKVDAERANAEKIAKIIREAAEKAAKKQADLEKSQGNAGNAQKDLDSTKKVVGLNGKLAKKEISQSDYNKELFAIRKNEIQEEIDAAQAQMDKFTEIDAEYFDAKAARLKAEKDLVKEKSDYEISQAEIVAERKKETEQAVFDFVSQLSSTLFEIGASIGESKLADLEHQKEVEIGLAGNNAEAKAKIEENYNKKILAQKRKQAIFDKAEAIFNIGLNTAIAVTKVLAQTGILSPFVIPAIIAAGALQAAAVLAKPLPKYKDGRKGGKAEYAIVNDGKGPEILEKNGRFRIAGGGKETVTYLEQGETVHPYEKSAEMFEKSNQSDQFLDSMLIGTSVIAERERQQSNAIADAIIKSKTDPEIMKYAFKEAIRDLPFSQFVMDEQGFRKFNVSKNSKIEDQNRRNSTGGNG